MSNNSHSIAFHGQFKKYYSSQIISFGPLNFENLTNKLKDFYDLKHQEFPTIDVSMKSISDIQEFNETELKNMFQCDFLILQFFSISDYKIIKQKMKHLELFEKFNGIIYCYIDSLEDLESDSDLKKGLFFNSLENFSTIFNVSSLEESQKKLRRFERIKRILFIDDDLDQQYYFNKIISNLPFYQDYASSREVALKVSLEKKKAYDYIFIDYNLEGQMVVENFLSFANEIRVIEKLKQNESKAKVFVLSAMLGSGEIDYLLANGIDGFLQKPLDRNKLFQMLGIVVNDDAENFLHHINQGKKVSFIFHNYSESEMDSLEVAADLFTKKEIKSYLNNRKNDLKKISHFFLLDDFDSISRIAHDFKGTGASYGFPEVTRIGRKMEAFAIDSCKEEVQLQIVELKKFLLSNGLQLD